MGIRVQINKIVHDRSQASNSKQGSGGGVRKKQRGGGERKSESGKGYCAVGDRSIGSGSLSVGPDSALAIDPSCTSSSMSV